MINESQPEFKKKIISCLKKCAPNQYSINLEQLSDLLPLTLWQLAWIIAVCDGGYSCSNIPWEYPSLQRQVNDLHAIFSEQIEMDINDYSEAGAMPPLIPAARIDATYKLMDIQRDMDFNSLNEEISTYKILSLVNAKSLHSLFIRLFSAIRTKQPRLSDNPLQMMPWIKQHNKEIRTKQIMDTFFQICIEQPIRIKAEKINMPIQSYNLAWVIVICNKKLNYFEEVRLQELELTSLADYTNANIINYLQKTDRLHELNPRWFDEVDLRGSDTVKQKLSYEISPDLVLKVISNKAIYKVEGAINFETIIDSVLKQDFALLIRETFPDYTGKLHKKTSAPHKLIIKVMIIMLKLDRQDITWSTVKEFIEEHIVGIYERETLIKFEDINDDTLLVDGRELTKKNATKKVGDYKRDFKI